MYKPSWTNTTKKYKKKPAKNLSGCRAFQGNFTKKFTIKIPFTPTDAQRRFGTSTARVGHRTYAIASIGLPMDGDETDGRTAAYGSEVAIAEDDGASRSRPVPDRPSPTATKLSIFIQRRRRKLHLAKFLTRAGSVLIGDVEPVRRRSCDLASVTNARSDGWTLSKRSQTSKQAPRTGRATTRHSVPLSGSVVDALNLCSIHKTDQGGAIAIAGARKT